jgi:hypothetical protein
MMQPTTSETDAPGGTSGPGGTPHADRTSPPKEVTCPVCATVFDPRATTGRCPVCGEQVVPTTQVTRSVPGLTPAWAWVKTGGWRIVLVGLLVIYEVVLLIIVWQRFAAAHAF